MKLIALGIEPLLELFLFFRKKATGESPAMTDPDESGERHGNAQNMTYASVTGYVILIKCVTGSVIPRLYNLGRKNKN